MIPKVIKRKDPLTPSTSMGFRPKLRYRKLGKGSFHLWNSIVKPNQVVLVYPEDIPADKLKFFECLDSAEMQELAKAENEKFITQQLLYKAEKVSAGWYLVVNANTEKPLNGKKLRKTEAEELCALLNS